MTYDRDDNIITVDSFGMWFDQLTKEKQAVIDDIAPEIANSSTHEYNGISTDWRFTYTGRGYF